MVNSAHRRRRGPVTRRAGRVVLHASSSSNPDRGIIRWMKFHPKACKSALTLPDWVAQCRKNCNNSTGRRVTGNLQGWDKIIRLTSAASENNGRLASSVTLRPRRWSALITQVPATAGTLMCRLMATGDSSGAGEPPNVVNYSGQLQGRHWLWRILLQPRFTIPMATRRTCGKLPRAVGTGRVFLYSPRLLG